MFVIFSFTLLEQEILIKSLREVVLSMTAIGIKKVKNKIGQLLTNQPETK